MIKIQYFMLILLAATSARGQSVGLVDKKTKEFTVPSGLKTEFAIFGYELPNTSTKKMICFSSRDADVRANFSGCPLGSYFDTDRMNIRDKIVYLGPYASFAKMNFISATGKKTIFYLPKSSFKIK